MRPTLDLSKFGSKGNEEVLHTPQLSRTGGSTSDAVLCYTQDTFRRRLLLFGRGYSQCILSPTDRARSLIDTVSGVFLLVNSRPTFL